jgi:hypothetical protein
MYPVHMSFSCTYRVHELKKFTKNLKTFTHVISILLHLYIKFQVQIPSNEGAVKNTKFLINLKSEICQKFLFFCYS